jgi:hypothetical protein
MKKVKQLLETYDVGLHGMNTQPRKNFTLSTLLGLLFAMFLTILFSLWLTGTASARVPGAIS